MRTAMLALDRFTDDDRDELEEIALDDLREPGDWNADTRGPWGRSFEAFDGLRRFVLALTSPSGLQWTQGGVFDLLATFESGDGENIMDDGLNLSAALYVGDEGRTFAPLLTVFVDDVVVFLGETPTAKSAASAIRDAINDTLSHFTAG